MNPYDVVQTNVLGTYHVLEAARELGVERVVHTSTSEVYGSARYVPMNEAHPLQGQSPYSASKIGADKLAESFFLSFGLPVTTVRPFNTYGPRQSARAVIPTIITQALTQDFVKLGALYPRRDFTFATDTAAGFIAAAESDRTVGEVVNLGTGEDISVGELVDLVVDIVGRDIEVRSDEGRVRPEGARSCACSLEQRRNGADGLATRRSRSAKDWGRRSPGSRSISISIEDAAVHSLAYRECGSLKNITMKAVIMAGGRGTRLPFTKVLRPSRLFPWGTTHSSRSSFVSCGRPDSTGIILTVNYLAHLFQAYFGNGERQGCRCATRWRKSRWARRR